MPLAHGAAAASAEMETRVGGETTMSERVCGSAAIARDISLAAAHVLVLPPVLRTEVRSAISSAQAAATTASEAMRAATGDDESLRWRAGLALEDACVALSAAGAELRFVLDRVEGIDAGVTLALRALEHDVATLAANAVGATGA